MNRKHLPLILTLFLATCFAIAASAQGDKAKRPSPPATAEGTVGEATVVINYSQPGVKGREVWGGLVPYGKVWRTGANEATSIEASADIKFADGSVLPAGKYGLFTIPNEDEWTVIFNSVWDQWGAYGYDSSKDVLRVTTSPQDSGESMERMTFTVDDGEIKLWWDDVVVSLNGSAGS